MMEMVGLEMDLEGERQVSVDLMRQKWESLSKHFSTKLQLLQNTLRQDHKELVKIHEILLVFKTVVFVNNYY